MAFSMPRDGVIRSIAAYFSTTVALGLIGSNITVRATLYSSAAPNNQFTPVPGAVVDLSPSLSGLINIGTILFGSVTNLNIPVTLNTRLLMVFSAYVSGGIDIAAIVTGFASAGLGIG
jgi:BclB C-terminal domain-containing protein